MQAAAEKQLRAAIMRARRTGDINKGYAKHKADSGAVVVMDVRTGGIVAMASYPTYNPNIWVGGISDKDYKSITSKKNNYPNQSRAFQGEFAPASTFKAVSLPAAVKAGYSLQRLLQLPVRLSHRRHAQGATTSREGYGVISMRRAIEVSCDTVFYKFAYETWLRQGGLHPKKGTKDPFTQMAKAFGLGKPTGLDLPSESDGRIADRAWKRAYWKATERLLLRQGEDRLSRGRAQGPASGRRTCCSCPRRTAPTAGPTAAVTPPTSRSGRATRRRRRCRWHGSMPPSPTAARWSRRTSAARS